jgi:hypothetical protein
MIEKEKLEEIQRAGAEAFRRGAPISSNPYLNNNNTPARTGEDLETWQAKVAAWSLGYQIESLSEKED